MGVPNFIIHFYWGFSTKSTIQSIQLTWQARSLAAELSGRQARVCVVAQALGVVAEWVWFLSKKRCLYINICLFCKDKR